MSKQEKIREGVKQYFKQNWLEDGERAESMTRDIFDYLHSQGVVIKAGDDIEIEMDDGTMIPSFTKYEPLMEVK